jgi:hypothetical protein
MLQPMLLQPQETEARAMPGHKVGICEEWLAGRLGLLECQKELAYG